MKKEILESATLLNMDCMEYMAGLPDKAFDLAIVDPPYFEDYGKEIYPGAAISTTGISRKRYHSKHWEVPDKAYFDELFRVSENQIIWGCNYYAQFIPHVGRIVWDKKNDSSTFSKAELASQSFKIGISMFRYEWNGMLQENMKNKEERIHPTQKPVKLYEWLLKNYAKQGHRILDTHGGSMSSVIAALKLGFEITCIELDEDYFNSAVERVKQSQLQADMFHPKTMEKENQTIELFEKDK